MASRINDNFFFQKNNNISITGVDVQNNQDIIKNPSFPLEVILEIFSHLNFSDFSHLGLINHNWNTFTKREDFWKELLRRDFGIGVVCDCEKKYEDGNYKKSYVFNYSETKKKIEQFGKELLENSNYGFKLCGLVNIERFNENQLINFFEFLCSKNFNSPIKAMINDKSFEKIEGLNVVQRGLWEAIVSNNIEIALPLIARGIFKKMMDNSEYRLDLMLDNAVRKSHLEITRTLIKEGILEYISPDGANGFKTILFAAIDNFRCLKTEAERALIKGIFDRAPDEIVFALIDGGILGKINVNGDDLEEILYTAYYVTCFDRVYVMQKLLRKILEQMNLSH